MIPICFKAFRKMMLLKLLVMKTILPYFRVSDLNGDYHSVIIKNLDSVQVLSIKSDILTFSALVSILCGVYCPGIPLTGMA